MHHRLMAPVLPASLVAQARKVRLTIRLSCMSSLSRRVEVVYTRPGLGPNGKCCCGPEVKYTLGLGDTDGPSEVG